MKKLIKALSFLTGEDPLIEENQKLKDYLTRIYQKLISFYKKRTAKKHRLAYIEHLAKEL